MRRSSIEYTILDSVTPKAITSSTDATPIVVTKASHGLTTGDLILIYGHTTNIAANGIRKVTVINSSTFSLQDYNTGQDIAGSGAGAGGATGIFCTAPKILSVEDFKTVVLTVITTGTATTTLKASGSVGNRLSVADSHGDTPNFGATQGVSNLYDFVQIIDLQNGASTNGNTGIVVAGTDIQKTFEVNVNLLKYFTVLPVSWTQGAITIKAKLATAE